MRNEQDYPPCEAPNHNERCSGVGNTVDHFTPECIGKLWGWTNKQINAPENLQHLSRECHNDKDKTTEARLTLARRQLKGAYISLGEYLKIFDPFFNLQKEKPNRKKKKRHEKKPKYAGRRDGSSRYSNR